MLFKSVSSVWCTAFLLCGVNAYANSYDDNVPAVALAIRPFPKYHKRSFQNFTIQSTTFLVTSDVHLVSTMVDPAISQFQSSLSPISTTVSLVILSSTIAPLAELRSSTSEQIPSPASYYNTATAYTTIFPNAPTVSSSIQSQSASQASSIFSLPVTSTLDGNYVGATQTAFTSKSVGNETSIISLPPSVQISNSAQSSIYNGVYTSESATRTGTSSSLPTSTVTLMTSGAPYVIQTVAPISGSSRLNSSVNLVTDTTISSGQYTASASLVTATNLSSSVGFAIGSPSLHNTTVQPTATPTWHGSHISTTLNASGIATESASLGWDRHNASTVSSRHPSPVTIRTTMPHESLVHANKTHSATHVATPFPVVNNRTTMYTSVQSNAITESNSRSNGLHSTASFVLAGASSSSNSGPKQGATQVVTTTHTPSTSPSQSAAAAPPPLTTSETAGVAVAGVTGLLFAAVAAFYIARRHHAKRARRASTGSDYPRIAFLYDPPKDDPSGGDTFGSTEIVKPGGPRSSSRRLSESDNRRETNSWRYRFTDPGNPFNDPGNPLYDSGNPFNDPEGSMQRSHTSGRFSVLPPSVVAAAAASSTTVDRSAITPQNLPDITRRSAVQSLNATVDRTLMVSPVDSEAFSPGRHSILGEIASMAYNPRTFSTTVSPYQSWSSIGRTRTNSSPTLREINVTRRSREPSEKDLLIHVDSHTETIDSAILFAPVGTPGTASPAVTMPKRIAKNASSLSLFPMPPRSSAGSNDVPAQNRRFTTESVPTSIESRLYSSDANSSKRSTSSTRPDTLASSISGSPVPVHRGWDEIRRYSEEKVVPPSLASSVSLSSLSPPPSVHSPPAFRLKKKSLVQLRRKSPASVRSRQDMQSSAHLPLTVKIPFAYKQTSTFEIQNPRRMPKVDEAADTVDDEITSPGTATPAPQEIILPIAAEMQQKRSHLNLRSPSIMV